MSEWVKIFHIEKISMIDGGGMKADLSIDFHSVAVHQDALEVDGID